VCVHALQRHCRRLGRNQWRSTTAHTGQTTSSPLPQRNSRKRSNALSSLSAKIFRTDNERASAESRKCCDMAVSECVELDARIPQVVAHSVSPCRAELLIRPNVQVLHNAD